MMKKKLGFGYGSLLCLTYAFNVASFIFLGSVFASAEVGDITSHLMQKPPMQKIPIQIKRQMVDQRAAEKAQIENVSSHVSTPASAPMAAPMPEPLPPAGPETTESTPETIAAPETLVTVPTPAPTKPTLMQKAPMQKIAYKKPALTPDQIRAQELAAIKAQYLGR